MRKQYHFCQVGEDTLIWDVHHLIELIQNIELVDIQELSEAYWHPRYTSNDTTNH